MPKGKTWESVCTVNWSLSPWPFCILCVFISKKKLAESHSLLDSKQHLQTEAIITLVNCHTFLNSFFRMWWLWISSLGQQRGSVSCLVPSGLPCGSLSDLETASCPPSTQMWLGQLSGLRVLGYVMGMSPTTWSWGVLLTISQSVLGSLFYKIFVNEN